jgi:arylsulfatase A-like enzyme
LIHGYYASVSFIDAQIGRLLDELDRLGLRDNTAVVVWGDHGWNLGEHGWWSKNTNYEISTRTAMLASLPGVTTGRKTDALVELVDVYPTLSELAGLPRAGYLEGTSFVPLMHDPQRPWKRAAFSLWIGSRTMRTDRYRLTRYDKATSEPTVWQLPSRGVLELFDHQSDPDENVNVADRPEYRQVLSELIEQMDAGWQAARPAKWQALGECLLLCAGQSTSSRSIASSDLPLVSGSRLKITAKPTRQMTP